MQRTAHYWTPPWQAPTARAGSAPGPQRLPSKVWSAQDLLDRAGQPKSDLPLCCGWTWTRSVSYKLLVADLRAYDGLRAHPIFQREVLSLGQVRHQLVQLRFQLRVVYQGALRYLERREHSRRTVVAEFAQVAREELELLIKASALLVTVAVDGEAPALSLAHHLTEAANTLELSGAPKRYYDSEMELMGDWLPGRG